MEKKSEVLNTLVWDIQSKVTSLEFMKKKRIVLLTNTLQRVIKQLTLLHLQITQVALAQTQVVQIALAEAAEEIQVGEEATLTGKIK